MTVDRSGRTFGRVDIGKVDVNAELVHGGRAWVYRQYMTEESLPPLKLSAGRAPWATVAAGA
jgi:endonuclease YncB( thermonuclease family)